MGRRGESLSFWLNMTVISYPIPAYQNLPIEPQFYKPSQFFIEDITRGKTTVVTTTADNNYVIGQLIRLLIPPSNGIRQLNQRQAYVIGLPAADQVTLDIDSRDMDAFTTSTARTQPQIVAIGDINTGAINTGRTNNTTYIYGSFQNISPL